MMLRSVLRAVRLPLAGLLFLVSALIGPTVVFAAATAVISVSPSSGTQGVGTNFPVDFKLDTGGQTVGGVGIDVSYSSNLEWVSADASGAVFDQTVVTPSPQNNAFNFVRVRFDNGFTGSAGQLLRVTFRALSPGQGTVTINKNNSEVISTSDFSNILQDVSNALFTLQTASALSPSSNGSVGTVVGQEPINSIVSRGNVVGINPATGSLQTGSGQNGVPLITSTPTQSSIPRTTTTPTPIPEPVKLPSDIALCFTTNLRYGMRASIEVAKLQKALHLAGVYPANILSGNFFSLTVLAVIKFQNKYRLSPAVGFVGPLTRGLLNAIYCSTAKSPATLPSTAPTAPLSPPSSLRKPATLKTLKAPKKIIIR